MSKVCGIYQIRNISNGHLYIGSSRDVSGRIREHKRVLRQNKHHSAYLQYAWNKYGESNFVFALIIPCELSELLSFEQDWLDAMEPEYNMAPNAGSSLGRKVSTETKARISAAKKGKGNSAAGLLQRRTSVKSKGYAFLKKSGKYQAQIYKYGKRMYLGIFDSKEEAVSCYESAFNQYIAELKRACHGDIE